MVGVRCETLRLVLLPRRRLGALERGVQAPPRRMARLQFGAELGAAQADVVRRVQATALSHTIGERGSGLFSVMHIQIFSEQKYCSKKYQ